MKSWEVWFRHGQWGLYIRDYFAQGCPVDYHLVKKICEQDAVQLVQDKLAGDLYGQVRDILISGKNFEEHRTSISWND